MFKVYIHKAVRLLPKGLRERMHRSKLLSGIRRNYFESDTRMHDRYYDAKYYAEIKDWANQAGPAIAADIIARFAPKTLLDVGCGSGEYLVAARDAGLTVAGIELAKAARDLCLQRGLDVVAADLTKGEPLPRRGDVVMSCEVAEHLPESAARPFVAALCGASDGHVVLTAARPGQEGQNHLNCQPKEYWVELFKPHGFAYEPQVTADWERANVERKLPEWWCENLMVFRKTTT